MRAKFGIIVIAGATLLSLAACGDRNRVPELMNLRQTGAGADEFGILPTKPLELPTDVAALPEPTPGGSNRTDPTPEADVVAALGGNPAALGRTGVPAGDGGLVGHAARFGSSPTIRAQLAAEDLDYRRRNDGRLLERVFNLNIYFKAYKPLSLDQYAELERWRALGVRTVGAPPRAAETSR
ncbi:DUF3035 domain-containing protein [Frigidibacter mobilis]|uniref:Lipoprotein n=1 Tax=Frigidibacter mobilis TaxID=1335048 RepID=A0A159Z7K7_9RHOB|nr:DUF3035 domain-containing protein [Frigidibacter mobilis]AMY71401.1 lipoprotein [Frigidibacter mobilis]